MHIANRDQDSLFKKRFSSLRASNTFRFAEHKFWLHYTSIWIFGRFAASSIVIEVKTMCVLWGVCDVSIYGTLSMDKDSSAIPNRGKWKRLEELDALIVVGWQSEQLYIIDHMGRFVRHTSSRNRKWAWRYLLMYVPYSIRNICALYYEF